MNAISDLEILKMQDEIDARDFMIGIQNRQIAEKESKEKILVEKIFEKDKTIDGLKFVNDGHWKQILLFGATMKKSEDELTQNEVSTVNSRFKKDCKFTYIMRFFRRTGF